MRLARPKHVTWLESTVLFVFTVFLFSLSMGGVFRYYLASNDQAILVQTPKLLLVACMIPILASLLSRRKASYFGICVVGFLTLFSIVGWLYVQNYRQTAFGLWILVPLIFGILASPYLRRRERTYYRIITLVWLSAVVGVYSDWLYSFPWEGYYYTVGDLSIEASRGWTTLGLPRLAGFGRASFETANLLLALGVCLVAPRSRGGWRFLIWILTGVAIALTTSKSALGAFVILTLLFMVRRNMPGVILRGTIVLIAVVGMVLPLSSLAINYALDTEGFVRRLLLASFDDRLTRVWPQAVTLVRGEGNVIFGRGVGGIGTAQLYFEPAAYSPGDNLYIYLYGLFGVCAMVIVLWYVRGLLELSHAGGSWKRAMLLTGLVVLITGVTTNVLESSVLALFAGMSMRQTSERRYNPGARAELLSARRRNTQGCGRLERLEQPDLADAP